MLVTALGEIDRALEAWRKLRPELDLQTIEDSVFSALPLVYRRLEAAGLDDPDRQRLKGIYRSTWARNTIVIERLRDTMAAARQAGVPVLLVGSIGAALRYYDTIGLRPTGYLELLVREGDLTRAVRALGDAEWSTRGGTRRGPRDPLWLFDDRGQVCVLRSTLATDFLPRTRSSPDAPLWEAAVEVEWKGAVFEALCPTDDLLAAIVTGARAAPTRSLQWLVDAAMIMASSHAIDWDRLYGVGVERLQGLRLREAFAYLARELDASAPQRVRERLGSREASMRERLTYTCTTRRIDWLGSLPQAFGEHLAVTSGQSPGATIGALPRFFRERWQVDSAWRLPAAGGRRAVRNLRRRRHHGQAS